MEPLTISHEIDNQKIIQNKIILLSTLNDTEYIKNNILFATTPHLNSVAIWDITRQICLRFYEHVSVGIINSVKIKNNLIFIAGGDYEIIIWNIETNKRVTKINAQTDLLDIIIKNNLIICAQRWMISIWDLNTYRNIKNIDAHKKMIYSIVEYDNLLITSSVDNTIKIWNLDLEDDCQCIKTLNGHTAEVLGIYVINGLIVSSSCDTTIKIWELESGICKKTFKGHTKPVVSVFMNENYLISSSNDKTIKIWDIESEICIRTINYKYLGYMCNPPLITNNFIIVEAKKGGINMLPIYVLTGELPKFREVINNYNLAFHLECEILNYFGLTRNTLVNLT